MQIQPPYLMFLGDVPDRLAAKTAYVFFGQLSLQYVGDNG